MSMTHGIMNSAKVLATVMVTTLAPMGVIAQTPISVRGTVVDETGEPVIGANVVQKGTTNGVITDFDGNFVLNVPQGAPLVISFIGYSDQEVEAAKTLRVVMSEDQVLLDEAVVIGYGSVKKSDATGSVTAIKPDKMNRGQTTNAQDLLSGKVAGVNVTNGGGTPGSGATIRIRGGSSLNASNDPLIVIDGLPMDNSGIKGVANPLSTINPNDIESFTVLKDASATAIYGSRASNGVIIITTKKGQAGSKPTFAYDGNVSLGTLTDRIEVMDAAAYKDFVKSVYPETYEGLPFLGNANTDWQDQIYRQAFGTDHNITVTGGLKNMPYRVSLGYTNQEGVLKTSEMERYTGSFNLSPSLFKDHLKVNLNAKGMYIKNQYANGGAVGAALTMDPTQPIFADGDQYNKFGGYYQWIYEDGNYNALAPSNPVAMLAQKDDRAKSKSFLGNAQFDYKFHFLPELKANLNLAMDYSQGRQDTYVAPEARENNNYGNQGYVDEFKTNKTLDFYLQYAKGIGEHDFDVMGGYAWQHFYREGDKLYNDILESPNEEDKLRWMTESYLVSFFGRVNYTFNDKYLATVTVRQDGTSRFAEDTRWGVFPSLALGWKLKEEAFLQDVNFLTDLKLRLGYGVTGQQQLNDNDYGYFATYTESQNGAGYPVKDENGDIYYVTLNRPDAYNPDLKWEQTSTYNAGVDFGFIEDRITGSLDAYYRETTDLLAEVDIPVGTNFSNRITKNIGSLVNKGFEASVNTAIIQTEDVSWDLGVNATYNVNEITALASENDETIIATGGISSGTGNTVQGHAVGYPASSFYLYEQVYNSEGKPVEGMFVDRDGDGVVTEKDRYFVGSPAADWTFGLNTKVTYKGWDLGMTMRASLGNLVYNDVKAVRSDTDNMYINGYWGNLTEDALVDGFHGETNYYLSDYFLEDGSFLRIDNITLGYTFKNLFNSGLYGRLYGTISNPALFSKYSGLDPEIYGGIDNAIYPRSMTSIIGLSLSF